MKKISLIFMITIVPMILRAQTANVDVATPTATAGNITSTSTGVGINLDAIGITSPTSKLDMAGILKIRNQISATGNQADQFYINVNIPDIANTANKRTSIHSSKLDFYNVSGSSSPMILNVIGEGTYTTVSNEVFKMNDGSGTANGNNPNKVEINLNGDSYFNGGKVGIGTDSPSSMLDVAGTVTLQNSSQTKQSTLETDNSGILQIRTPSGYIYNRITNNNAAIFNYYNNNGTDELHSRLSGASLAFSDITGANPVSLAQISCNGPSFFNGGKVGIGTDSPTSILHLKESASSDQKTVLKVEHEGVSGAWGGAMIELGSSSSTQALSRIIGSSNYSSTNSSTWGNNRSILAFQTMNSSGQWNTIQMDSDGRLGIGTTTPAEALDVVGNASVSGELKLYRVDGNGTPTDDSVRLKAYTGGSLMIKPENGATYIRSEDTSASNILLISGSYSKGEYGKFSHNRMVFSGNIDSDGNGTYDQGKVFVAIKRDDDSFIDNGHGFCIGRRYITPGYVFDVNGNSLISGKLAVNEIEIGTTTTSTDDYVFKCHGKIGTKSIQVRQDENWPDYVFDEEYDLMKLDSLQQFVKTEKHLPGVETATEIETNGLDLGAMQTTQMQKIEELTLYLLQLNQKLQEQDKSVQQLQEKVETLQNENASLKQSLQKNK